MLPNEKPYNNSLYLEAGIINYYYISKIKFNFLLQRFF